MVAIRVERLDEIITMETISNIIPITVVMNPCTVRLLYFNAAVSKTHDKHIVAQSMKGYFDLIRSPNAPIFGYVAYRPVGVVATQAGQGT
jgi:hypothetical protein